MIDRTSRYSLAPTDEVTDANGRVCRFVVPPILPHPGDLVVAQHHQVSDSDRPDILAARAYGQATAWTLIANANTAAHPDQLTQPTGVSRVLPRPEGQG